MKGEVSFMDEQKLSFQPEQETEPYEPRPRWQVWGARIGLVLFVALIIMSYLNIARGGL